MEKINVQFFYECGANLRPFTRFTPDIDNRMPIYFTSFSVHGYVYNLLYFFKVLTVCRYAGAELIKAILEMQKWMKERPPDNWRDKDLSVDKLFGDVINKAKQFETIFLAELQTLATYHVTQKGAYYIPDIIDRTEIVLPESIQVRINEKAKNEIRQSGRCLAFDNPTASGFHIIRAVETVMHEYYLTVCKPTPVPERLVNWGAYITELRKSNDPSVKETITILQQIKDNDRNLIMHPERVLSLDDAFTLFEIAKGAIMSMASILPEIKKGRTKKTAK